MYNDVNIEKTLKKGGIVVMPTDTIYGIVGSALNKGVVERIYKIRRRAIDKPCIILISGLSELKKFSIILSKKQEEKIKEYWPSDFFQNFRPTSIILDCVDENFSYLHRGTQTLAFRVPFSKELQNLLIKTGPLIAPSANPAALAPAEDILEAKRYFGNTVALYLDGGRVKGEASTIVRLYPDASVSILRV